MANITFITKGGEEIALEASTGNLMELAVNNNVQGIEGECGGVCSCATCHVHVAADYFSKTGAPDEIEADMLELDDNVSEYSRLGCQVQITEDLDGMVVHVAND